MTRARLHLVERGRGAPVLVLPGLTFPGASWAPVWEKGPSGLRWLAVDLPGHGESAPWDVVRPWELADAVAEEVGRRGLPPPVVVGHSYGALVAAAYAGDHPVAGLVTVDQRLDPAGLPLPPGGLPPGGARAAAPRLIEAITSTLHAEALDSQDAARLNEVHQPAAPVVEPYLRAVEGLAVEALLEPVAAAMGRLRAPWADVHHAEPGQAHRERVSAGRASVQVWPGSSHCVQLEHPGRFAALVASLCDVRGPADAAAP